MRSPSIPGFRLVLAPLLALLACLVASSTASAGENLFIYTLTSSGRTGLQVTPLELLPTLGGQFHFADIAADDGNRWVLSVDGRVFRNGTQLLTLPFPPQMTEDSVVQRNAWIRLVLDEEGQLDAGDDGVGPDDTQVLTLTAGGLVMLGNTQYAQLSTIGTSFDVIEGEETDKEYLFADMIIADTGVFALRTDGELFDVESGKRVGTFEGGPAVDGALDGEAGHTQWMRLAENPSTGSLYALRADGLLVAVSASDLTLALDPDSQLLGSEMTLGSPVASLPGNANSLVTLRNLYIDLEFSSGGGWHVLRRDGGVYSLNSQQQPFLSPVGPANFGANPVSTPLQGPDPLGNPFIEMLSQDGEVWRVRSLGQFYQGATLVDQLLGFGFVGLAVDSTEPDLQGLTNKRPALTVYKPRVVEGEDVVIPIIPIDVDQPVEELTLSFDLDGLPGAAYDAKTGNVVAPGELEPGRYSIRVTVDDGGPQKPVRKKYKVRVVEPAPAGGKVPAPLPTRMSRSFALIGHELALPIKATDRNGDPLTIEPLDRGIFKLGATFDSDTNTLHWLPECIDAGRQEARFKLSNGSKTSRLKVRIDVLFPLYWENPLTPD